MSHLIETEINGEPCAFEVNVILSDGSFEHHFGTAYRADVDFDVESWEGCSRAAALQWCNDNASKLIDKEMTKLAEDLAESGQRLPRWARTLV